MEISTTPTARAISSTESRALDLLGQGISVEQTAAAIGVSPSAVSQLLSDPEFSTKVAEARYLNLSSYTLRDRKYDALEDKLLDKVSGMIPMIYKPGEAIKALTMINAAKRRGAVAQVPTSAAQEVVVLNMPTMITQHFQMNVNNQVVKAGQQELVTIQSSQMEKLLTSSKSTALPTVNKNMEYTNVHPTKQASGNSLHASP